MPQFFPNGPIVPDKLVQDLEDDRVVLFCGAGISMGAGLPNYKGLVEHCCKELTYPMPEEQSSDWDWPDRMLGALETHFTAEQVRRIVADRLNQKPHTLSLHRAILKLAQTRRREGLRLVTTNFDTYFEKACKTLGIRTNWHSGPVLPIPRNDRKGTWSSLVYLHGRLDESATQQLVLTSADFGRAYLTEAWAARFVARLFADFTVLFIGYSFNDPVLRYMTDAFAAEDAEARFAQPRGPAYIFVSHQSGAPLHPKPYQDRNLQAIFYDDAKNHLSLKQTLVTWADWRADYLANTTRLINSIAPRRPDAIDPTDTANLLWAVTGRPGDNGHGARVFAGVTSLPPIEWFDEFERRERDLITEHANASVKAKELEHPIPFTPQLDIALLFPDVLDLRELALTPVANALIPWLVRHLGSEGWVERVQTKLAEGRRPHAYLRRAIQDSLIQPHSLLAGYVRFWWIVTAEGGWTISNKNVHHRPYYAVIQSLNTQVDPHLLKQEVLAALRPVLGLSPSSFRRWRDAMDPTRVGQPVGNSLSEIADAEVNLADGDQVDTMINAINAKPGADAFWAGMLEELTSLLHQVLDLYAAADEATRELDPSSVHRPSIVPHQQNLHHRSWTVLFDLIWQSWKHVDTVDPARSRAFVTNCRYLPYLAFRRIAAAAVAYSAHFTAQEQLEVLLHV